MKPREEWQKLVLLFKLSPGDILTGTAAIFNLHITYPGIYTTKVKSPVNDIFKNMPFVFDFPDEEADVHIEMNYPTVHQSDTGAHCFINGYTDYLSKILNKPLVYHTNKPMLFLSEEEKQRKLFPVSFQYAVIDAGVKYDYPIKQWPIEYYQEVVNQTKDIINWVQIGSPEHRHVILENVYNLIGQTNNVRDLFSLVYNSVFGLGPITFLTHVCAAFDKPYLCILGGRESPTWVSYPLQQTFHTLGLLDCCKDGGCWVSKPVPSEQFPENNNRICKYPMLHYHFPVGRCMSMISPEEVISCIRRMKNGNLW